MKSNIHILGSITAVQMATFADLFANRKPHWISKEGTFKHVVAEFMTFEGRHEYMAWVYSWRMEVRKLNEIVAFNRRVMTGHGDDGVKAAAQSSRHYVSTALRGLYAIREAGKVRAREQHERAIQCAQGMQKIAAE